MGAGYSSTSKASIQFGLKEQNFLGKGQKAKFQADFGENQTAYDISFEEPYYKDPNNFACEISTCGFIFTDEFGNKKEKKILIKIKME